MNIWRLCVLFLIPGVSNAIVYSNQADEFVVETQLGGVGYLVFEKDTPGLYGACTAQPLSKNVLISAAHCTPLTATNPVDFYFDSDGDGVFEGTRRINNFVDHPGWSNDGRARRHLVEYAHDLSLLWLSSDLPDYVPIYQIAPQSEIPVGSAVRITGYGLQGEGNALRSNDSDGVLDRRVSTNIIDSNIVEGNIFQIDFDNKQVFEYAAPCTGKGCLFVDKKPGSGYVEGTIESGDSGGGIFIDPVMDYQYNFPNLTTYPNGALVKPIFAKDYLIGINSHGSRKGYGKVSGGVFLGSHIDWLKSHLGNQINIPQADTVTLYSSGTTVDFGVFEASNNVPEQGLLSVKFDNCPLTPNPDQTDFDGDGIGNACDDFPQDSDLDNDFDGDGIINEQDSDDDNDGFLDIDDSFPFDPNENIDSDSDGTGNNADPDDDNDGIPDELDDSPLVASTIETDDETTNSDDMDIIGSSGTGSFSIYFLSVLLILVMKWKGLNQVWRITKSGRTQ